MDDVTLSQMKPNDTPAQQDLTNPSAIPDALPESTCPECGGAMHVYWQPGYGPIKGLWYATCWAKPCRLEGVTLERGQHEKLDDAQRRRYADAKAQRAALDALDEARCYLAAKQYVKKHPLKTKDVA